jgi:hypothetical protein
MVRTIHITNGDSTAGSLRIAGLGGSVLAWRDVLSEGPLPATDDLRFAEIRAAYLAGARYGDITTIRDSYAEDFRRLAEAAKAEEVALWFEHDLHDQLQLVFLLAWLSRQGRQTGALSLISVDRFPGIERFTGLGQLQPAQLAALYPSRRLVEGEAKALGREAWDAFTAATPARLNALALRRETALPFLRAAVRRYLEEYPALRTGLSRTEQTILTTLGNRAATTGELFQQVSAQEDATFMGDWSFWRVLRGLARGPHALITLEGPASDGPQLPVLDVRATSEGHAVLAGELHAVTLRGVDRWHGGVHLLGPEARWAWDAVAGQVVPLPRAGGPA